MDYIYSGNMDSEEQFMRKSLWAVAVMFRHYSCGRVREESCAGETKKQRDADEDQH